MTDLEYLVAEAFEFTLDTNPHASSYETIEEHLESYRHLEVDWISEEQRLRAIETQKFVSGQVYPNGSVAFYLVYGTSAEDVIERCARLCREDQARYRAAKLKSEIKR